MYIKYTSSYYNTYLLYYLRYYNSVNCIGLPMKCCTDAEDFVRLIRLLFLLTKLFKFEAQKCGQIVCTHKPYFLMPDHIRIRILHSACMEFHIFIAWASIIPTCFYNNSFIPPLICITFCSLQIRTL